MSQHALNELMSETGRRWAVPFPQPGQSAQSASIRAERIDPAARAREMDAFGESVCPSLPFVPVSLSFSFECRDLLW
jgi:hypothetical protein